MPYAITIFQMNTPPLTRVQLNRAAVLGVSSQKLLYNSSSFVRVELLFLRVTEQSESTVHGGDEARSFSLGHKCFAVTNREPLKAHRGPEITFCQCNSLQGLH